MGKPVLSPRITKSKNKDSFDAMVVLPVAKAFVASNGQRLAAVEVSKQQDLTLNLGKHKVKAARSNGMYYGSFAKAVITAPLQIPSISVPDLVSEVLAKQTFFAMVEDVSEHDISVVAIPQKSFEGEHAKVMPETESFLLDAKCVKSFPAMKTLREGDAMILNVFLRNDQPIDFEIQMTEDTTVLEKLKKQLGPKKSLSSYIDDIT